jgi:carboxymethylenebutenolidase
LSRIHESLVELKVADGTQMQAFVAMPEPLPQAGILVFQEAFGVNNHIKNIVRRLAGEGFVAIAPELFHRTLPPGGEIPYPTSGDFSAVMPHINAITREGSLTDFQAAYDWLKGQIKSENIGCIGFCMGGSASFTANSRLSLKAAVSYYGTRILQNLDLVSQQKGPLLLVWGGKDKGTPPEKLKELTDSLRAAGKDFINAEFSEAAHAFNCEERPAYHPASAVTAWGMTLAFFQKHLNSR